MEKIYLENIQQIRLVDDEVAERVATFISFHHFFDHQIVGSKGNFEDNLKGHGRIYMGTAYWKI